MPYYALSIQSTLFIAIDITHLHAIFLFFLHFVNNSKMHAYMLVTMEIILNKYTLILQGLLKMFISALSLILVAGFSTADTQANGSCSVCNCQLKKFNAENLIGFIDNRVQTVVQNILNALLADQPSKNHKKHRYNKLVARFSVP